MGKIYEVALKIAGSVAKSFRGDTLAAAGALGKLTGAAKQLRAAEQAATGYKKLDAAVAASKTHYNTATEALRRLDEAERAAGGATKESTKWRKAGNAEVARSAKELDRATAALAKNQAAQRNVGQLRMQVARERLFGEGKKESTPLFQKAGQQIGGITNDMMRLASVAGGAAVALGTIAFHALHAGDEIGDTAEKLGIGSTALQELRYGAEQSGAEVGALDKSLGKMAVTIGKFKSAKGKGGGAGALSIPGLQMLGTGGSSTAGGDKDPFKQLHLNAKALSGLKPEQQLAKIAEAMKGLKTHDDKAAVAQAIFGKGAKELLPFLAEGAAGIKKLSEQAHKYGGVMSPEAIANADLADKAMRDAKMAISGLTTSLGAELLPVATQTFKEFSEWVASNRETIKAWAQQTATWIGTKAIPTFREIATTVANLAKTVAGLIDRFGAGNIAIGLTVARLAPLGKTLLEINGTLFRAAGAWKDFGAAQKAAQDAGGLTGADTAGPSKAGRAIGIAANLAMLAQAAAIGYAIGKAMDDAFGISDFLAGKRDKETTKGQIVDDSHTGGMKSYDVWKANQDIVKNQQVLAMQQMARMQEVVRLMAAGHTRGEALYLADNPGGKPPMPKTGQRSGPLIGSLALSVGAVTKDEATRQLAVAFDDVHRKVMAEIDRQNREREGARYE